MKDEEGAIGGTVVLSLSRMAVCRGFQLLGHIGIEEGGIEVLW